MSDATTGESVDLALLARLLRQLTIDVGSLRDDMRVLTALVLRMDATLTGLPTEVRAIHGQHSRTIDRVRALEEKTT